MRAEIARGITLVIDRYSYSGVVYSAAKNNPKLDVHWAWQPEIGLPRPDLLLFLHIQPEVAALRGGYGAERYESGEMQRRVRTLFETLIRQGGFENAVSIDAGQTPEEVEREISAVVENHILEIQSNHPLGSFGPLDSTEHGSASTGT
jgi:dTMP kinase